MIGLLLAVVLQLNGVVGGDLRARAYFDANNVKVGDPMLLTLDFQGEVDFSDLHPPALNQVLDAGDWKLDMASAKVRTDNRQVRTWFREYKVAVGRSITYRIRPLRPGVLWFPAIEFGYLDKQGAACKVTANAIPVHAKPGSQVVVPELGTEASTLPQPDALQTDPGMELDEDAAFAWRKACARPTADAFARFGFAAGRMNEARCAILEGNWARALKIYSRLEWSVGQTPAIERGMLAAFARRYDRADVELPVWRQVGRPILKYPWWGRAGIVLGGFAAVGLVFWLLGRGIRALACLAAILMLLPASAQDLFQMMQQQMQQMRQQMNQALGPMTTLSINGEEREPVRITAWVEPDRKPLRVGDGFEFIVSLEAPKASSIGGIRMTPSETFGMTVTGPARNLDDGKSGNPSNVVKRLAVPVRYDVPFRGQVTFSIEGQVSGRETRNGGRFQFSFSNSFQCETPPLELKVEPLDPASQPADFSGIVSEGLTLTESCDRTAVETNDVITVTYRLRAHGYIPPDFLPAGAAFEWTRDPKRGTIEYIRYLVADGASETPSTPLTYYDSRTKRYVTVKTGGTPLKYVIIP